MSLEQDLADISGTLGHMVKLDTGRLILPGEDEYRRILDKAASVLYDEPIGSTLRVARLIVERQERDFGVYIHVGNYK